MFKKIPDTITKNDVFVISIKYFPKTKVFAGLDRT